MAQLNHPNERKIKLLVTTYKVPIKRELGKIVEDQIVHTDHFVSEQIEELDGAISIKLPEFSKKIGRFNTRQMKYAEEDTSKDFILKKIIKNPKNS